MKYTMKHRLICYIEKNLDLASQAPDRATAQNWYSQAFGALSFYSYSTYDTAPQDEAELIERWNNEWRPKFEEIVWGK